MSDSAMNEPAEVADSGLHLQDAHGAPAPADSALSLLGSLLSLPPRASKRRRGSRFKLEDAAPEAAAAAASDEHKSDAAAASASASASASSSSSAAASSDSLRPWRERKFEYLDHTADIQLHSWGDSLEEAMEQVVIAMFSYVTDLTRVDIDPARTDSFVVEGHDLDSLLFNLLDEFLYRFATNEWIPRDVEVTNLDLKHFRCAVKGYGEAFTLAKHTQGTEIKAITYSNMQILRNGVRVQSDNDRSKNGGTGAAAAAAASTAHAHARADSPVSGQEVSPPPEAHVDFIDESAAGEGAERGAFNVEAEADASPTSDQALAAESEENQEIKRGGKGKHGKWNAEIYVIVDI